MPWTPDLSIMLARFRFILKEDLMLDAELEV
jgi:hypothetical protein